jgi:alkanesulfonate monooxygenase SsuD/methylene tetrahydromethanopterin reductase-like flavin-dependent oxidoreductase (luciferase family)
LGERQSDIRIGVVTAGDVGRVRDLEARPIDSLWVGGHISSRNPSPETMVGLARLAAVTERVSVGSSILLLPLYPPALVAKQVADLDRSTGGRLILGVGVGGEYPQEFRAVEVPMEQRGGRTNEIIPLLRKFWTATEVTHHGRYYEMQDVRIHPAPTQPGGPPIVVAGRKDPSMRRAAIMGDGWFPYMYSPRRYAESVQKINNAAEQAGRDLAGFHWCVWIFLNIGPDGDVAREEAARTIGGTYDQDVKAMVDSVAAAGTVEHVTAKLQAFYDAGARHFVFLPVTGGAPEEPVLDRLFAEVLPPLHGHAADASGAGHGETRGRLS